MKPPYCEVCDALCDPDGLIVFKRDAEGEAWDRWVQETGATGHPPYAGWFCPAHLKRAQALQHLTIDEALKQMR